MDETDQESDRSYILYAISYRYLELLGSGLYVLQQLALVIGYIWASGDAAVQKRLVFVMHQCVAPPFQSLPFPHPFFALRR